MKLHRRVVLRPLISGNNDVVEIKTRLSLAPAVMKRLRIQGFIITDYVARFPEATEKIVRWIAEGKLKHKETVVEGLENAPNALNMLFDGSNLGKLLVKVSEP